MISIDCDVLNPNVERIHLLKRITLDDKLIQTLQSQPGVSDCPPKSSSALLGILTRRRLQDGCRLMLALVTSLHLD